MMIFPPRQQWTKIGDGASAEVWAVDRLHVIKIFHAGVNDVPVALAHQAGQWAAAQGLPVARSYARIVIGERPALLMERIDGPDMLRTILQRPLRMWSLVRQMAHLHAQIHALPGGSALPRQIDVLRHRIVRSQADAQAVALALRLLDQLPQDDRLAHGDFHPANLMLSLHGPVIIDWAQASSGVPAADAARTELLLRFGGQGKGLGAALNGAITARWYRHCYARASGMNTAAVDAWRLPVAVAWHRGQGGPALSRLTAWIARLTKKEARRVMIGVTRPVRGWA